MGPSPRSLAAEANDCFMVRVPCGSNRIQGRGAMLCAPMAGSPRVVPTSGCCGSVEPREGRNWHRELDKRIPIQGVVGDLGMGTVLAASDVAAERHRSAALDGAHHLELAEADVTGVGGTPGGPVVAEDVRDLQCWAGQGRDALRRRL